MISVDVKHHVYLPHDFWPSLISRTVSVDVKHHVYLLTSTISSLDWSTFLRNARDRLERVSQEWCFPCSLQGLALYKNCWESFPRIELTASLYNRFCFLFLFCCWCCCCCLFENVYPITIPIRWDWQPPFTNHARRWTQVQGVSDNFFPAYWTDATTGHFSENIF